MPGMSERMCVIAAVFVLLVSHVAAYRLGACNERPSRAAAERVLGTGSPLVDVAALALDQAAAGARELYVASVHESVAQCRVAVRDASRALAECNARLGVLVTARKRADAAEATRAASARTLMVTYERDLQQCADWAAQPVCPR